MPDRELPPDRRALFVDGPNLLSGALQIAIDLLIMIAAYVGAVALRFEFSPPRMVEQIRPDLLAPVLGCQLAALYLTGCYKLVWRYVSIGDLPRLAYGVMASTMVLLLVRLLLPMTQTSLPFVPLSVVILNAGILYAGICGVRLLRRAMVEQETRRIHRVGSENADGAVCRRVLLVGAGSAGNAVVKDLKLHGSGLRIMGFLDDDPDKRNGMIQGVKVIGTVADLPALVRSLRIDEVIVTMVNVPRRVLRDVTHMCETIPVPVRIVPGYFEIVAGSINVSRIRDVDIEDLLGREPVTMDEPELARFISGRRVLITGAGGSIGSELSRQVARFGPSEILLAERAENALYEIHREIRGQRGDIEILPLLADVADERRIAGILSERRPQVIVHAAAHKHVPMMEMNPGEAIKNNTLAARRLGELALEAGVERVVQVSTDKAVNPTSVMGASKRLAELALQDLNGVGATQFVAVRFGNVLGSAGSVIPLFREQIRRGGPVTVTHPDMVRYFMTIPEAVGLILQAAAMAQGGEIFVLDMGEPVRIVDLAEEMIRLSGFRPHEDIAITFTGMRPGEKLFEELSTDEEDATKTRHPRIFIGRISARRTGEVTEMLARFRDLCSREAPAEDIRAAIRQTLPEALLK
jgi:FlaA1/EpsC-like NDP-sugar epimerase